MAGTEEKAIGQESRIDLDSDIGASGKTVTRREKILFAMSMIRTLCGLLSGIASAIVLWKILEMAHR
jgi:hypothetical protein